jgi:PncC family amidohydrolase
LASTILQETSRKQPMKDLMPLAERIAAVLKERKETIAIAESSAGGLISAALLAVPGASAYFVGGAVLYTMTIRKALLDIVAEDMAGFRAASEPDAQLLARRIRERSGSVWSLGETGAAGPTGNRYGDPAGHVCFAVMGPVEKVLTVRTGSADRMANMLSFAGHGLKLLEETIRSPK